MQFLAHLDDEDLARMERALPAPKPVPRRRETKTELMLRRDYEACPCHTCARAPGCRAPCSLFITYLRKKW